MNASLNVGAALNVTRSDLLGYMSLVITLSTLDLRTILMQTMTVKIFFAAGLGLAQLHQHTNWALNLWAWPQFASDRQTDTNPAQSPSDLRFPRFLARSPYYATPPLLDASPDVVAQNVLKPFCLCLDL